MKCPYCPGIANLRSSKEIYSGRDFGLMFICENYPICNSYVGCHQGTKKPLGTPANEELRKFRNLAHSSFDALWRRKQKKLVNESRKYREKSNAKYLARSRGYKWLSENLNIEFEKCHIGMFDIEKCKKVISVCKPYLNPEHINQINRELVKIGG